MSTSSERLQVLIEPEQRARLEREALRRGSSVATSVREAIDEKLPGSSERHPALRWRSSAEQIEVGSVDGFCDELDRIRADRR